MRLPNVLITPLLFVLLAANASAAMTIDEAIARGDLSEVQRQLESHPDRASKGTHPRLAPLHQAILRKRTEIARALIQAGADVNAIDSSQRTPVHLAVVRNLPGLIASLANAGAKLNEQDAAGWTPLHWAAAKDQLEMTQALIAAGADAHARSAQGGTILHEAAATGGGAIVQLCLEQGVDPNAVASDGGTALQVAQTFKNEAAVSWLAPIPWAPDFDDASVSPKLLAAIKAASPVETIFPVSAPRRILLLSATSGYRHKSIPTGKAALTHMGESTGAYTTVVSDAPANFEVNVLKTFDAVVLLNTTQDFFMPSSKAKNQFTEQEWIRLQARHNRLVDNLVSYVRGGGGLVGIHSATDSCYGHADYGQTMGAYFDGHPWMANTRVTIAVEDPGHDTIQPVFGELKTFDLIEEIYQFKPKPYSRERLRILLALEPQRSDAPRGKLKRSDNDYPVAWVQSVGEGRVFYTSLGHNHHIYTNPLMLNHYLAGIQFACGDLPADTTPSAQMSVPAVSRSCCGSE